MIENKSGELVAVMANTVAEARHSLTVPEQRLILWLVAQIEREDDALKEHKLSVPQFKEILGESNNGRLYEQIEQACDRLQTRVLEIRTGPRTRKKFNWLHEVEYLDGEGKVRMRFHDNLKPVLLQLRERFCAIPLKAVFQLHSGYSIRWLEMLHSRKHQGSFFLSIDELRDWLHIAPGELSAASDLRSRAIEYPRRDLDKKAPLSFTYTPGKEGRRITGWTFAVKENKPKPKAAKKARRAPSPSPAKAAERLTPERITALKQSLGRKVAAGK